MADIPQSWEAYARLQQELSSTHCAAVADALEEALNVVLQPDFRPDAVSEADLSRVAESAARRTRHRKHLLRTAAPSSQRGCPVDTVEADEGVAAAASSSLDDEVHARRELARLKALLRSPDWDLLTGVAAGASYEELAVEHSATTAALRSRVSRLRKAIG